jgi:hypothetical protein
VPRADHALAYLLDLEGEEIVYDGGYVARFRVRQSDATSERPHGISYSLTFHAPDGQRLMGYDNAHNPPRHGGRYAGRQAAFDHWHRDKADQGRPYQFETAEKLIADFFDEIERILKERNDG